MLKLRKTRQSDNEHLRASNTHEYLSFNKLNTYGLPFGSCSIEYNETLALLAIGTNSGLLKIVGHLNQEYIAHHDDGRIVANIKFSPKKNMVISICENEENYGIYHWEFPNNHSNQLIRRFVTNFDKNLTKVSVVKICPFERFLLFGTENGHVHYYDTDHCIFTDYSIYQDSILRKFPSTNNKFNYGSVIGIEFNPIYRDILLIAYKHGLILLYNNADQTAIKVFSTELEISNINWHPNGNLFASSHSEGAIYNWSLTLTDVSLDSFANFDNNINYDQFDDQDINQSHIRMDGKSVNCQNVDSLAEKIGNLPSMDKINAEHKKSDVANKETDFDESDKDTSVVSIKSMHSWHDCSPILTNITPGLGYESWMNNDNNSLFCSTPHSNNWLKNINFTSQKLLPFQKKECKSIKKVHLFSTAIFIFTGGENLNEDHVNLLTILSGDKIVKKICFSEPIIDFCVIMNERKTANSLIERNNFFVQQHLNFPKFILVLTELELLVIKVDNLFKNDNEMSNKINSKIMNFTNNPRELQLYFQPQHLPTVQMSAITASTIVSDCPQTVIKVLKNIGVGNGSFTLQKWFIGTDINECVISGGNNNRADILITGHQDGCISFWLQYKGSTQILLVKIDTKVFYSDYNEEVNQHLQQRQQNKDEININNMVAASSLYSIKNVGFCKKNVHLFVGGLVGNILIINMKKCQENTHSIIAEFEHNFYSKGPNCPFPYFKNLNLTTDKNILNQLDYELTNFVKIYPPIQITALSFSTDHRIIAFGTQCGFTLVDYSNNNCIYSNRIGNTDADKVRLSNQRKSFIRSMRRSFKRSFRKIDGKATNRVSMRRNNRFSFKASKDNEFDQNNTTLQNQKIKKQPNHLNDGKKSEGEKIMQKDINNGTVTYLAILNINLIQENKGKSIKTITLIAGMNSGKIFFISLVQNTLGARIVEVVHVNQIKEYHLKNKAPVLNCFGIDGFGNPLEIHNSIHFEPKSVKFNNLHQYTVHYIVVVTSEQVKVLYSTNLKTKFKYKINSHEKLKISSASFFETNFQKKKIYMLSLLTNCGKILILTLPNLDIVDMVQLMDDVDNISSIKSVRISEQGFGYYIDRLNQIVKFSMTPDENIKIKNNLNYYSKLKPSLSKEVDQRFDNTAHIHSEFEFVDIPSIN